MTISKILTAVLIFGCLSGSAQIVTDKKFSVRNAFEDPSETASPARLSFTLPENGKNSWLVNLGISYSWIKTDTTVRYKQYMLSPFIVFNRNTMIGIEQYNFKAGAAFQYVYGQPGPVENLHTVNLTGQYMRNVIDSNSSLILTGYWTLFHDNLSRPAQDVFINHYKQMLGSSFFYYLQPTAGLEFQDIFLATDQATGFQARVYLNPSLSIAWRHPSAVEIKSGDINPYHWPKILELTVSYVARFNYINSLKGSENYVPLFTPALTWFPTRTQDFSVAFSYSAGSDPVAGLRKQDFWQLALQLKI